MADQDKYEEWLSTIANTRFLFNTIAELETFLDAPSIHNNGIKRCFNSYQRLRSAFRDLHCETDEQTNGCVNLKKVMIKYQKAWLFFRDNLARRSDPFNVALELLRYSYPPYSTGEIGRKRLSIFNAIEEQHISVPFIILMLLKVIPGYDSKNGDVTDIDAQFERTLSLLEKFTEGSEFFSTFPTIIKAKEEPQKTRLMLYYHVSEILNTYEGYAEQANLYDTSSEMKLRCVDLDMEGFWNECDGEFRHTFFWQIEQAKDAGTYFATLWQKDANNNLTRIKHTLFLIDAGDGKLTAYIQHPEAMKHRMQGLPYTDNDHVWYKSAKPTSSAPDRLSFSRVMTSSVWAKEINLTKVTYKKTLDIYANWIKNCKITDKYKLLDYTFLPNLHAITEDYLYIPTEDDKTEDDKEFYQIPTEAIEGLDQIKMGDNVGLMKMGNKYYLAFDELLLYIPVTKTELQKYGIKKVDHIE